MEEIVLYERVEGGQPVNLRANHGRHDKHTLTYTNTTNGKKSSILSIRMRKWSDPVTLPAQDSN